MQLLPNNPDRTAETEYCDPQFKGLIILYFEVTSFIDSGHRLNRSFEVVVLIISVEFPIICLDRRSGTIDWFSP